ncbi:type IV pilin protein [Halomonas koreensis]|uniref:Type IV pilin protein n=1 Tax=Halomonas koreensis TaxID=245385 RepID=A0ABU1G635_9GAMM|nr:type IV pilin protein [Halomonas koreensis]MDR5867889.1 type IV pilin protein [Halomonas koreensis]
MTRQSLRTPNRRRPPATQGGFTLLELMIVVAVVAILAAIAYPSYTRYVQEARRTDAMSSLLQTAGRLERCYTVTNNYASAADGTACVSFPVTSQEGFYEIDTVAASTSASTYVIKAEPASGSPQGGDGACPSFTLDQTGDKGPEATEDECWE